jgi:kumamolisin
VPHFAWPSAAVGAATAALLVAGGAAAQPQGSRPQIVRPASGIERPQDIGVRAHTNVEIFVPPGGLSHGVTPATAGPPVGGALFETPASLACVYRLVTPAAGCNPYKVTTNPTGGSHAIAIVDAYDYPAATSDLNVFISQFGLAAANFTVIYGTGNPSNGCANGAQPPNGSGSGWDLEAALDIEWAHAMAPSAKLYLVEANSNSYSDLLNAEQVAAACVQNSTEGEVSNSWASSEFSGEGSFDSTFTATNLVYYFAAGDSPGVSYPAASPNVVGVGGSALSRDQIKGAYHSQSSWENQDFPLSGYLIGTGGGPSAYEGIPGYQSGVSSLVGTHRGTPDLGAIADPATGVWIYNTTYSSCSGWCTVGGTSVATPVTAAISNKRGLFFASSAAMLNAIYNNTGSIRSHRVTPIANGNCGPPGWAMAGGYPYGFGEPYDPRWIRARYGFPYNYCTGWGSLH